jgi:hypothetical protein
MENIWKVILGVFISAMIIFSGLGILEANNAMNTAEQYLYIAGSEISASDFAEEVSRAKMEEAKKRSYELEVRLIHVGEGKSGHTAYAVLTMQYPYEISLLHLRTVRTKQLIVY